MKTESKGFLVAPLMDGFCLAIVRRKIYCTYHTPYHSQNDSGDLRGVAGGDGELGCLCGKAGTSLWCDGSAHSSGCVVNGSNAMAAF